MLDLTKFYINGSWVNPHQKRDYTVINPANEEHIANISLGSKADVDSAVSAAKKAFPSFANTSLVNRIQLLENLLLIYNNRSQEMAEAISLDMGAPMKLAKEEQASCGIEHIKTIISVLDDFCFNRVMKTAQIIREPIGVCGLITPWNWPINQITCKVIPALAVGCTTVLKASELAPFSSHLFADMINDAGYPDGVFNLVDGLGYEVGATISAHTDIAMVSFTGSTKAGVSVSKSAAETVKRVCLELGGKSPNIILDHNNFKTAVENGVSLCFRNSGQSCNAPTRMLVPEQRYDEAIKIAKERANTVIVGYPNDFKTVIGPLVSKVHFERVQRYIDTAIKEGARLVSGGIGKPNNLPQGYYVKPTIFADLDEDMTIVKEEVFGPVLCIQKFKNTKEAIAMANNTPFGLAAYISGDAVEALSIASSINAGMISINGNSQDFDCPFGGYKQSGNGREWGEFGLEDYLETKAIAN